MGKRFLLIGFLLFLLGADNGGFSWAQGDPAADFPNKPITFIVQFAAGGVTDISARKLVSLAEKEFKQAITVVNMPGGTGNIGHHAICKAKPDGYTVGTIVGSGTALVPHMRTVPFNTKEDFSFIIQFAEYGMPLCVRKNAPWKTLKELIEYARQNPGKVTYNTIGPGSGQHLTMEKIIRQENIKMVHVPFKGGADGVAALLGGHITASLASELAPHVVSGEARALAVLGQKRLKSLPDVPTLDELGYKIETTLWLGIVGPRGIHPAIHKKLEETFTRVLPDPSFHETLDKLLMTPLYKNGEDFKKLVFKSYDMGKELVESAGMLKK
jgi:tripartite-type tricarboxylate transporter receptor subunit TctC